MTQGTGLLSLTIFLPLLGAVLLMFVPHQFTKAVRGLTLGFTSVTFLASLAVLQGFSGDTYHFQMVEQFPLVPSLGIMYRVGLDGISIWLFMITTLLTLLAGIFSHYVDKRAKNYFVLLLMLETAMLGVFTAMDMIVFYTFFEFTLIPMALMIFIWGGKERSAAAVKFFIYTFAASIFLLLGMIVLALHARTVTGGDLTFDITAIQALVASGQLWESGAGLQTLLFWMFSAAFIVKCPMVPVHTWLPDAHTEAPTAGSVILAGVLLKMGTYGFLRFTLPFFPEATKENIVIFMVLAVVGITYGAIVATMQKDVKKLVAYSSVAHMGFVVYGIFSLDQAGMMGGAYQQLSHGISTGALFLLIGLVYERTHTRDFAMYGGLKKQMPIFAALFLIVMLSSVGLPPLNGFVGEFLALLGGFQTAQAGLYGLNPWFYIFAGTGVILAAVYLLWMFQKMFYGKVTNADNLRLKDLKPWEIGLVGVFVVFIFWGGLYPNTFLKPMEKSVNAVRMMVVNEPGQRPSWQSPSLEINDQGDLFFVERQPNGEVDWNGPAIPVARADFYRAQREGAGE